jgi:oxalate decarboxylase/phosphoglucose isomerase-like protein (cupin superfamily)
MAAVQFIDLRDEIHHDVRGMSFFPWQGRLHEPGDLLRTFHLISIRPGHTRGNHLHPGHAEWLYPFHGNALLLWETEAGQVQERLIFGDSTLIFIPPGIGHALKNPGAGMLYLLAWRQETESVSATGPETVPHPVKS